MYVNINMLIYIDHNILLIAALQPIGTRPGRARTYSRTKQGEDFMVPLDTLQPMQFRLAVSSKEGKET